MVYGFLFRSTIIMLAVCLVLLLISTATDIKSRVIPNALVLAILLIGLFFNTWAVSGLGIKQSLLGFGAALLIMLPVYLLKGWGAGDVKLMAAVGSVVGLNKIIDIILYSVLLMGLMSVIFFILKALVRGPNLSYKALAIQQLPMAPAIAVATFYVLLPVLNCSDGFIKSCL